MGRGRVGPRASERNGQKPFTTLASIASKRGESRMCAKALAMTKICHGRSQEFDVDRDINNTASQATRQATANGKTHHTIFQWDALVDGWGGLPLVGVTVTGQRRQ